MRCGVPEWAGKRNFAGQQLSGHWHRRLECYVGPKERDDDTEGSSKFAGNGWPAFCGIRIFGFYQGCATLHQNQFDVKPSPRRTSFAARSRFAGSFCTF